MKTSKISPVLIGSAFLSFGMVADAAPPKSSAEPDICVSLMNDYEMASKKLAYNEALGSRDDSAPRATMRESENNNILNEARFTMDLMRSNGCKGPTYAPNWRRYAFASLSCSTALQGQRTDRALDRLRGTFTAQSKPPECDLSAWTPDQ